MRTAPTLALALAAALGTCEAQAQATTSGGCSPVVADTTGDVTITLDCSFGPDPADDFEVTLLHARLACNSAVEAEDLAAAAPGEGPDRMLDLLTALQPLDGEFVYVDLSVWVGAGCGYGEVAGDPPPRWGVVYDLLPVLDGFTGNADSYAYGYTYENDFDYLDAFGGNATSTLLFPAEDGAFFSARYGKAMSFEGIARVRLSEIQGFQFVELMPALPVGGLATHFSRLRRHVAETYP
jgi:hypothetical protein